MEKKSLVVLVFFLLAFVLGGVAEGARDIANKGDIKKPEGLLGGLGPLGGILGWPFGGLGNWLWGLGGPLLNPGLGWGLGFPGYGGLGPGWGLGYKDVPGGYGGPGGGGGPGGPGGYGGPGVPGGYGGAGPGGYAHPSGKAP